MFFFGRFPRHTYKSVYNFPGAGVGLFVAIPRAFAKALASCGISTTIPTANLYLYIVRFFNLIKQGRLFINISIEQIRKSDF